MSNMLLTTMLLTKSFAESLSLAGATPVVCGMDWLCGAAGDCAKAGAPTKAHAAATAANLVSVIRFAPRYLPGWLEAAHRRGIMRGKIARAIEVPHIGRA